ncbi:MAG: hypothetical protein ACP5G4_06450, partial [bacterium]
MKYSWSIRPAEEFKAKAVVAIIIIVLSGIIITWAAEGNFLFGIIAVVLMTFASSKFFFKTYYYADETGIGEKFLGFERVRKWPEFLRADEGDRAVFLSPFEKPRRLDNYRGWMVPTPSSEIKAFVIEQVEKAKKKAES